MASTCDVCGGPLRSDNRSGVCRRTPACVREQVRRWRVANPDKRRETEYRNNLRRKTGLSLEQFEAMLYLQGGKCAVCRCEEPGGMGRWHVDHDHATGLIRGLLCNGCNTGTKLTDNVDLLRAKVQYLTRPLLRVVS